MARDLVGAAQARGLARGRAGRLRGARRAGRDPGRRPGADQARRELRRRGRARSASGSPTTTSPRSSTSWRQSVGEAGRWIHFGLTSSDVLDTGLALQLREAGTGLVSGAAALTGALVAQRARVPRHALRRAHPRRARRAHHLRAQAGRLRVREPSATRQRLRAGLRAARGRQALGRGRAPTRRSTRGRAGGRSSELGLQRGAGLDPGRAARPPRRAADARSRSPGPSLERLATEIRHLQRTEVREVEEPFREGQKGSSAMPHKRNPITSRADHRPRARAARQRPGGPRERGALARARHLALLGRAGGAAGLDHAARLHAGPDAVRWSAGMRVYPERMRENLELTHGALFSQSVLTALVEAGLRRDDAYRIVQRAAQRPGTSAGRSASCWSRSTEVTERLGAEQLDELFDYGRFVRNVPAVFERLDELDFGLAAFTVSIGRVPETAAELPGLDLHSRGKVREMYDLGDRLLMVASDRISAYDVVLPTAIPDKGKVLTGLSVFWFEQHRPTSSPTTCSRPTCPTRCAAARWSSGSSTSSRSSAWCAATSPARAGRSTSASGSVCGIALPAGLRESDRLPEPIFTPATKAELGEHDENVDFDRAAEIVGDRGADGGAAPPLARAYARRGRARRAQRASSWPTPSSSSAATPSGEIVLADEVLTPDSSRFWPRDRYEPGRLAAVVRQAVRARLARPVRLGPLAARPGAARRGRRRTRAPSTSRPTSASPGEPFERWLDALRVRVLIRPKEGILDPQGQAVERALPALGYEGVSNVHVGRLIELDVGRRRRRDRRSVERDVRAAAGEPADRELRGRSRSEGRMSARVGIVVFPGSCDEADALLARRAASQGLRGRSTSGTRDRDLKGVDAVVDPGRLLLRRLPARRRDRPLRAGDGVGARVRRARAARCSASATASRCCARRACCPARCCRTTSLRFVCRQVDVRGRDTETPRSPAACEPGEALSLPVKHTHRALLRAAGACSSELEAQRPGRAALRARHRTRTARCATSPASRTSRATCSA